MVYKTFLIEPSERYIDSFQNMADEFERQGEENAELYKASLQDFTKYVSMLKDYARGINLPDGWVPCHTYWLADDSNQVLGVVRIRTRLTSEYLESVGGNIGYDISPLFRRMGLGTQILKLALEKAKSLDFDKILVTCDHENIASRKIIEKNGGVFESEIVDKTTGNIVRRYWFDFI